MSEENQIIEFQLNQEILFGKYPEGFEITLELAKKIVADRLVFQNGKDYPLVLDISGLKNTTKDARVYLSKDGVKGLTMGAFITKNTVARVTLNFFLAMEKPNVPTNFFTNEEDAINWIKKEMQNKTKC